MVVPAVQSVFYVVPDPEAPTGSKTTERDAAGKQIAKWHDRLNQFNPPVGELSLKLWLIPDKNDPWQRAVGARERAASWKLP